MKAKDCISRLPVPSGALAPTINALLEFDGYYWWTNYPFGISYSGYWFNNQQWDPRCAFTDNQGLHLQMKQSQLPNGPMQWSSIEVVLWGEIANNPNSPTQIPNRTYPGFGRYLVAAQTSGSFDNIANNCCFGAFTYQFEADSSITNKHRELDMMECSRWYNLNNPTNGQFTLQPWDGLGDNVHRIKLKDQGKMTLVMDWRAAGQPVTFAVYYGLYDLSTLPGTPDISWTTSTAQNQYIPDEGCQTVHLNLWREPQSGYPSATQEVIISRFQFQPHIS